MDGRDAMLAVSMNGETLPFTHGFPVRMIVPGLYGYVSATKWLTDIELTTFAAYDAYWIDRGWAQQAPIKTESRIDTPRAGANVKVGTVMVAGVAWAQHRGIERVEVRVDGGEWHEATLAMQDTTDTWRQWTWPWRRDLRPAHDRGPRDRRGRRRPARAPRPAVPGRRHRLAHGAGLRRLIRATC